MTRDSAHLLVVDDQPELCQLLKEIFEAEGYYVSCVSDTAAARALIRCEQFDLALIDMVLKDGLGDWLGEHVRALGIRVLMMSGNPNAIAELGRQRSEYIAKPFRVDELKRRVHEALATAPEPPHRPRQPRHRG